VNIPFLDLKVQYQTIREQVLSSIERVLESSEFILGPNVSAFEQEIAKYLGVNMPLVLATELMHLFSFLMLWA